MSLKERIVADMKVAMKAREASRLESIRLFRAAIQRREVDERITLDDDAVLTVAQKQIKQSQDAVDQFEKGGREDLAAKERAHIKVIEGYLPEQMSEADIDAVIGEALARTGAESMRDMGKVIGMLKPKLQGRADMAVVSRKIKTRLQ